MRKKKERELTGVKEIAKRANVSIATVDRVLHNRSGVSMATKSLILSIIEELNYQPNILARTLASKKTFTFAILIPEVSKETAFWEAPLAGILKAEEEVKRYGIILEKYFFDQNNIHSFVKQTDKILFDKVDAVLMAPIFVEESKIFVAKCNKYNIPYLFINTDLPNQDNLCYIGPNLYHSGYMAAHLFSYIVNDDQKILVINVSKQINNRHDLLRKEEGFKTYFADNHKPNQISKIDINDTDYTSVAKKLDELFENEGNFHAIFVTNSRASTVARYIEKRKLTDVTLVGFDFLEENIDYMKKNIIDFLICQKPQEQGYKGVIALYNKFVHALPIEKMHFMPIDIISKENYMFYHN
jgi:LacI family transcriptional regulator